jgi:hypothetical protein
MESAGPPRRVMGLQEVSLIVGGTRIPSALGNTGLFGYFTPRVVGYCQFPYIV